MKRTVLKKDPIKEAVCEFFFNAPEWDWAVPGLVYQKIKEKFPARKVSHNLQISFDAGMPTAMPDARSGIDRMQFWDNNRKKVVQIGENRLSVHYIGAYEGWPVFSDLIQEVLEAYESEAPTGQIVAMSLRYINELPLPDDPHRIEDSIKTLPQIPDSENQVWLSWYQQVEIVNEEINAVITVRAGRPSKKENDPSVPNVVTIQPGASHKLDLMSSYIASVPVERASVRDWLARSHCELTKLFFASMKEGYLEQFEPEEVDSCH